MRGRQVGFLTLMLVAVSGVLALFTIKVVLDQTAPVTMPVLVTAVKWPTITPTAAAPTPTVTRVPAGTAVISAATRTPAPTEGPPPFIAEAAPTSASAGASGVTSIEGLPASAAVSGLVGHRQSLPLSCESRSAVDWAAFFGFKIDELEFLGRLPASDDPDRGFVGDVHGDWGQVPPNPYGVHAGPVAKLLTAYGVSALASRYSKWALVQREIAAGRPVLVWVAGHGEPGHASEVFTAADGRQTVVARFEHTVIVIGYSADTVTIADGAQVYTRPLADFLDSWGVLRNMAVTFDGL